MNTCYYCKKPIEDESRMLVKEISVFTRRRETFHEECWVKWHYEDIMTSIKMVVGFVLIMIIMFLIAIFLPMLFVR